MTAKARANLSRFHPDHGKSPGEHEALKAKRVAGKVPFVPKDMARAAFYGKKRR